MMVSGSLSPEPGAPYVVGVCSFEEGFESVASESVARIGDESWTLLSYSSSASLSGYMAVPDANAMVI